MNKVKYIETNNKGRDFIVGDLHGCYDELQAMLNHLNFNQDADRLFSVGDLIDRGEKNFECLELLHQPWFHAVKGNHEDFIDLYFSVAPNHKHDVWQSWVKNGGSWVSVQCGPFPTQEQYDNRVKMLKTEFVDKLPLVIVVGKDTEKRFNIVHAELIKSEDVAVSDNDIDTWNFTKADESNMLWGRTICFINPNRIHKVKLHKDLSPTYVGHTPVQTTIQLGRQIYIDTGAVFSYVLGTNSYPGLTIVEPLSQKQYVSYTHNKKLNIVETKQHDILE